jgi:cytoskeleton protein RodZ
MTSIGETLRRERQKRNLDLNQVSRELKISTRFLEAIESEEFERLPGGVFAKSFVRQYARLLNVDEEEAAAEVQRSLAPPSEAPLPELPARTAPPATDFAPRVESISNRHLISGSWLPALVLVVAVMLGCSLVYGWWQREHRAAAASAAAPQNHTVAATPVVQQSVNTAPQPGPAQPEAATSSAPAGNAPVEQSKPPDQAAEVKPALPDPKEQDPLPGQPPAPAGPVTVVLTTSDEPVWVLARTDGKYAFSGTIEPNQTRTVDAKGTVLLRLGNAGGVTITVNGKPIPSVGPKGQVRTVQLTSGGFQIVAPVKPSATPEGL